MAHRDNLYDQRQLAYRERELSERPESPERDRELLQVRSKMRQQNIDEARADELIADDPNAHYNKAAAREMEPEMLPPEGMKVIVATLVSCDAGKSGSAVAKTRGERQIEQQITETLGPEQGTAKYKSIYVHSKLLLVDDLFFTLGSANINARSLLSDSELNIAMPSPTTTKLWRERLWEMHSGKSISSSVDEDFYEWDSLISKNWECQKGNIPLEASLVRFWDVVTPYATAVD
ncbi:phospholipase D-like domain-containing protein [Ectopseudomonas khazarica]|uniref:Phospholipase D-like domain-containing protein n=1 Tax=Ectopseudomonas khazarica TaxID=2502979 RepID=A0ABW7MGA7_9GAMM